jgi:hypothetical protein
MGREERSLKVFGESVAYWGELQCEGHIERFDVALLNPYGDLNGFAVLHGTHEQDRDAGDAVLYRAATLLARELGADCPAAAVRELRP